MLHINLFNTMDAQFFINEINKNYTSNIANNNHDEILNFNKSIAAQALNILGIVSIDKGEYADAGFYLRTGASILPEYHVLWSNLCHLYNLNKDYELAYYSAKISCELTDYKDIQTLINLGTVQVALGYYEDAIKSYEKVLELNPDHHDCKIYYCNLLLRLGQYKKGFQIYESRFNFSSANVARKCIDRFNVPTWDGTDYKDKTLYLYNEQGAGDFIMFSRFLPEVKKRGGRLIVEVQESLKHILSNINCVDDWILRDDESFVDPAPCDFCASICSLPYILQIDNDEQIRHDPYIKAPLRFAKPLVSNKLKVGICWYGNKLNTRDHFRSMYLNEFRSIDNIDGIQLYGLSDKHGGERLWNKKIVNLNDGYDQFSMIDLSESIKNFGDLSYFISQLDLVITVDTAVAHLAGAMGKECWVLLNENIDWRWNTESRTAWYDSMRLFFAKRTWQDVMSDVKTNLIEFVSNRV